MEAGRLAYGETLNIVLWVKSNAGQGSFYRSQHEFVVVFRAGEAANEERRTRAPRSFAFECLKLPRRKHIRRRTYGGAEITSDCQARRACCRCDARLYSASRHLPGYFFGAQGRPLPGQRRYVAHRQRRSDADRLDTVVDPVKRHSLPPRLLRNAGRVLRKCGEAQIVTELKAVISQSLA